MSATPTKKATPRPRTTETVGKSQVNRSDLRELRTAWDHRNLVLFLGADISLPYGVPTWKNLILELLFGRAEHTRRLGGMWLHYQRALASWMTDYFSYNPLVLARMVERDIRHRHRGTKPRDPEAEAAAFMEDIRKPLYRNLKEPPANPDTALRAITRMVKTTRVRKGLEAAVTFNFDNLLELELAKSGVATLLVVGPGRQHGAGFRVAHLHGYLPLEGEIDRSVLVFTEDDFLHLTESPFHLGLSETMPPGNLPPLFTTNSRKMATSGRQCLKRAKTSLKPPIPRTTLSWATRPPASPRGRVARTFGVKWP